METPILAAPSHASGVVAPGEVEVYRRWFGTARSKSFPLTWCCSAGLTKAYLKSAFLADEFDRIKSSRLDTTLVMPFEAKGASGSRYQLIV